MLAAACFAVIAGCTVDRGHSAPPAQQTPTHPEPPRDAVRLSGPQASTFRHVAVAGEARLAADLGGGALQFDAVLFEGAVLHLGLANTSGDAAPVHIVLNQEGVEHRLFRGPIPPGAWHDRWFEVGRTARGKVQIVCSADSGRDARSVLVANPVLYQPAAPGPARPPNVVLYVIDALRPDHLPVYGYGRDTAPTLTALAGEGARFDFCFAPGTWSKPSVTTLLTGLDPLTHAVERHGEIAESVTTVAEHFRQAGYVTGAVSENPYGPPEAGLDQGFDVVQATYKRLGRRFGQSLELSGYTRDAAAAFVEHHRDRPFFLFVHTLEAHAPYRIPKAYQRYSTSDGSHIDNLIDRYDGGIRWADDNLRQLINTLQALGLFDHTLFVVTADHGEGFMPDEGGVGHHGPPLPARVHVPLFIRWPGTVPQGLRVTAPVGLADLAPTLLALAGAGAPAGMDGLDLSPVLRGASLDTLHDRPILSLGTQWQGRAVAQGGWMVWSHEGESRVYALDKVPIREHPGPFPEEVLQLEHVMTTLTDSMPPWPQDGEAANHNAGDAQRIEHLRALGYIN